MLPPSLVVSRLRLLAVFAGIAVISTVSAIAALALRPAPEVVVVHEYHPAPPLTLPPASLEAPPGKADDPLVVVARLVDPAHAEKLPGCGVLAVWATMQYEVVSIESGRLDARRIWVEQGCPSDRSYFRRGAIHRLRLVPPGDHPYGPAMPAGAPHFEAAETEALGAPR